MAIDLRSIKAANKALHRTAIPLRSIAAGELGRYIAYGTLTTTVEFVYKITYSNGRIYVVNDFTDLTSCFDSGDCVLIAKDFTPQERWDFTIRREITWKSETASDATVNAKEVARIREHRPNDPNNGYNQLYKPPLGASYAGKRSG